MDEPSQSAVERSSVDDEPEPAPSLDVAVDADACPSFDDDDRQWLRAHLGRVIEQLGLRRVQLGVVIVDDPRMASMHRDYLGVDGTTDVITFDLREAGGDAGAPIDAVDGEVYLCLDEARRRAEQFGHPARQELLLYATHGLLHLLGYDDHDEDDHHRMHAKEDELLEAVGVGATYGAREGGQS